MVLPSQVVSSFGRFDFFPPGSAHSKTLTRPKARKNLFGPAEILMVSPLWNGPFGVMTSAGAVAEATPVPIATPPARPTVRSTAAQPLRAQRNGFTTLTELSALRGDDRKNPPATATCRDPPATAG